MSDTHFLKLTPAEGKQAHLASDFVREQPKGQSPTLRRKLPIPDLKTKAQHDGAGYQFLKLTPDPPKHISSSNLNGTAKDKDDAASSSIDGLCVTRVEGDADWMDQQPRQLQFNDTANVASQEGSEDAKDSLTAWTKNGGDKTVVAKDTYLGSA